MAQKRCRRQHSLALSTSQWRHKRLRSNNREKIGNALVPVPTDFVRIQAGYVGRSAVRIRVTRFAVEVDSGSNFRQDLDHLCLSETRLLHAITSLSAGTIPDETTLCDALRKKGDYTCRIGRPRPMKEFCSRR